MKDPRLTTTNVPPPSSPSSGLELHLDTLSTQDEPFAEYLWMEHEEEFNRQVGKEKLQLEDEGDLLRLQPLWFMFCIYVIIIILFIYFSV